MIKPSRKRILMLTRLPFWRGGAGDKVRMLSLVEALSRQASVTVLYPYLLEPQDGAILAGLPQPFTVELMGERNSPRDYLHRVADLCRDPGFDACIIQRLEMAWCRRAVPSGTPAILDTHDLHFEHVRSQRRAGQPTAGTITREQELAILSAFDLVLMIQEGELAQVADSLSGRAILTPHPALAVPVPPRFPPRSLGFVGSGWPANEDALDFFLGESWPKLAGQGLGCHLWGSVCETWKGPRPAGWMDHGMEPDADRIWGQMDISINPVRWGSGLKIKSAEALGRGLPLVTTTCGASGLMDAAGEAFLVADDGGAFAEAILSLRREEGLLRRIAAGAHALARQRLSPKACYSPLFQCLGLPLDGLEASP